MDKGGAGVVWASARGLLRGPSIIGLGPHLAFKIYKLVPGGLSFRTPCLFALWCTAMVTFVGLALDHAGVPRSSTLNGTWRASVFDFKDSAFVEAAMAYFFSYRQQAGAS